LTSYINGPDIAFDSFGVTVPEDESENTAESSGSTGGGSITGRIIYATKEEEIKQGKLLTLKDGEKVKFEITRQVSPDQTKSEGHSLEIADLQKDRVTIIIYSKPITITLAIGEGNKLDLDSDGYYDFYVKLDNIENSKAYIFVQSISEQIIEKKEESTDVPETSEEESVDEPGLLGIALNKGLLPKGVFVLIFLSISFFLFISTRTNPTKIKLEHLRELRRMNEIRKLSYYKEKERLSKKTNKIHKKITKFLIILSICILGLFIFVNTLKTSISGRIIGAVKDVSNSLVSVTGFGILIFLAGGIGLVWIKMKRKPKDETRLSDLRKKKVYAENGNYIGDIKEVYLEDKKPKVYGWLIKVDKKIAKKIKKKNILLRHKHVKSIRKIMIIEEKVAEHLEKMSPENI
jgi:sporulation protein YlmC with PRC-barrel domain